MKALRCVVIVPYLTHVETACEQGLRVLETRGVPVQRLPAAAGLDRARSLAAAQALADGADELMWIDGDTAFQPDDVARLRSHPVPIVGAVCPRAGTYEVQLLAGATTLQVGAGGGLVEVAAVGVGFTLIRRTAFAALAEPYFLPLVVPGPDGHRYLDAGYALCHRARAAGLAVQVDTAIRVARLGPRAYEWETAGR